MVKTRTVSQVGGRHGGGGDVVEMMMNLVMDWWQRLDHHWAGSGTVVMCDRHSRDSWTNTRYWCHRYWWSIWSQAR